MKEIWWQGVLRSASLPRLVNIVKLISAMGVSWFARKSYVWGVPAVLAVEPTSLCNLSCPQCLVGLGKIERQRRLLDIQLYKQVLDEIGDRLWYLLLFNQGEPFLHPQLLEFIRIAKQRRIYVVTSTNGHFLFDSCYVTELVKSRLDVIIVSLDGSDAGSYSAYRRGGNFHQVVEGLSRLIQTRTQLHMATPKVLLQCLVTRHNEHLIPAMRQFADHMNVDRLLLKTLHIEDSETAAEYLPFQPAWRRYRKTAGTKSAKNSLKGKCWRLWYSAVLLADGRLVPCCFDKNGHYGYGLVQLDKNFEPTWTSDASDQFRNTILNQQSVIALCSNCSAHQKIYL